MSLQMLPCLTFEQLYTMPRSVKLTIIDVRSPGEFADSHIPGSINVPLLDDAQRAEIGTLYKRKSPSAALERALEMFESGFHSQISAVTSLTGAPPATHDFAAALGAVREALYVDGGDVRFRDDGLAEDAGAGRAVTESPGIIFYCWRGGARSKSMALFFKTLGFKVYYLEKGHKEFRAQVLSYLNQEKYPFKLCTLYGLTGCGKTKILQKWKAEGQPVIDLEELAHHRGSAFGQIGIAQWGQQKEFENNLYWEMRRWEHARAREVFVEGESKRIGRCQLPERFMQAMLEGIHVKVERTIDQRVELILREYVLPVPRDEWLREAQRSLESIQKRLGGEKFKELSQDLAAGRDADFVRKLLIDYYDKSYLLSRAEEGFYHAVLNGDEVPKVSGEKF